MRILGASAEVDDLCHEAFIKLLSQGDLPGRDTEHMSWLYRVSINLCINHLKKRENRRRLLEERAESVQPSASAGFDPAILHDRDVCQKLLGLVDDRTRATVLCRYLLGMTHKEITAVVGGARPTIQRRLARFIAVARSHVSEQNAA